MNIVLEHRKRLNLTQDQLAVKAGVSKRTIQRIEAGSIPKGYTLKAIAEALTIDEKLLVTNASEIDEINYKLVKLINLSSILFFIPLGNILIPLAIMHQKKGVNSITKEIVSIQIFWTITSVVLTLATPFVKKWFSLSNQSILVVMMLCILTNLFIVIRNSKEIDKHHRLCIKLNFSFI